MNSARQSRDEHLEIWAWQVSIISHRPRLMQLETGNIRSKWVARYLFNANFTAYDLSFFSDEVLSFLILNESSNATKGIMMDAWCTVYRLVHDVSVFMNIDSKWASICPSAYPPFSEWALVPIMDSLPHISYGPL